MISIRERFKITRSLILVGAFLILQQYSNGQNPSVMLNPWIKSDTTGYGMEIKRLIKKANGLAQMKLETAMMVLDSALELIKIAPDLRKYTVYLGNRGLILADNGRNSEATYWLERSVELSNRNRWTTLERKLINVIAVNYINLGKYDSALHSELNFLNLAAEANDSVDLSIGYNNLGMIYYKLHDPRNALSFYSKAEEIGIEHYNAHLYFSMGYCYNYLQKYDSALMFYELGKRDCGRSCTHTNMIDYNLGKGMVFRNIKDYDKALYYLTRAQKFAEEKGDELSLAESTVMLAEVNRELRNFLNARSLLEDADFLCQKNSISQTQLEVYSNFVSLFHAIGDLNKKSFFQSRFIEQSHVVYSEELLSKIALMETENKELGIVKRIRTQQSLLRIRNSLTESRHKVLILTGIVGGLLLIVFVLLILANVKRAKMNTMLERLVEEQTADIEVSYREAINTRNSFDQMMRFLIVNFKPQFVTLKGICMVGMSELESSEREVLSHVSFHVFEMERLGSKIVD